MGSASEGALRALCSAERFFDAGKHRASNQMIALAEHLDPSLPGLQQVKALVGVHSAARVRFGEHQDWYAILDVEPSAGDAEIRKQFRRVAFLIHPDKNRRTPAVSAFKLLVRARDMLLDKTMRLTFDHLRQSAAAAAVAKDEASACRGNGADTNSEEDIVEKEISQDVADSEEHAPTKDIAKQTAEEGAGATPAAGPPPSAHSHPAASGTVEAGVRYSQGAGAAAYRAPGTQHAAYQAPGTQHAAQTQYASPIGYQLKYLAPRKRVRRPAASHYATYPSAAAQQLTLSARAASGLGALDDLAYSTGGWSSSSAAYNKRLLAKQSRGDGEAFPARKRRHPSFIELGRFSS